MKKLTKYILLALFVVGFLALLYFTFYANGDYLLGAEGAFYIDAILLAKNFGYFWYNAAVGYFATSYNFVFHLVLLQWLTGSERLVNFVTIASLYILPFIAIYLICLELKLNSWLAFLFSLFYMTNPFTIYFLYSINQWNMIATYLLPAFFLIILKFYHRPALLFIIFGLHSVLFAFGNANPPTMAIYQIAILLDVVVISLYLNKRLVIRDITTHYLLLLFSFILFNFWWLINWLIVFVDASSTFSTVFSLGWLKNAGFARPALWRSFSLHSLLSYPRSLAQDYLDSYFSNDLSETFALVPLILVTLSIFRKELAKHYLSLLGIMLIIVGFLAKGTNPPFGDIYEFAVRYLPLFKIFKTAPEKWGVLFVYLLTLYLILAIQKLSRSSLRTLFVMTLSIYTIYSAIPLAAGMFLPDYTYGGRLPITKHFPYKKEYLSVRKTLNEDPIQYRVLSLPGHLNYQIALDVGGGKYYGGPDPVLTNTNKPFIASYNHLFAPDFLFIFHNLFDPNLKRILGLYNVKKVVINKDMFPWFGYPHKENTAELEEILDRQFVGSKDGSINLYDVGDAFMPRIYLANQIIKTDLDRKDFFKLATTVKTWDRPAIFFGGKERRGPPFPDGEGLDKEVPDLVFQKINPTKYLVKITNLQKPELLVFSENYHHSWKVYSVKQKTIEVGQNATGRYFDGGVTELTESKPFFDRKPWQTWGRNPIADNRHYEVNGYASAWLIKPEDFGGEKDVELILEYQPQRLFYPGVAVSVFTLLTSLAYITRSIIVRKKTK